MQYSVSSKFNKGQEKANKDHPTMNSQMSAFLPREDYWEGKSCEIVHFPYVRNRSNFAFD